VIAVRLQALISIKQAGEKGVSKRGLAQLLGVNHNSIQRWRSLYEQGGIDALMKDGRIGFKPSLISAQEHDALSELLNSPVNGMRGYVELQEWLKNTFDKTVKYNTLLKYCGRNFGSKSKVARPSHIKKDREAGESLKKTSVQSAGTTGKGKKKDTIK
jgi:transposase